MEKIRQKINEENAAKERAEEVAAMSTGGKKQLAKGGKKSDKGSPKRGQTPANTPGIRNQTSMVKANANKDFKEG